MTSCVLVKCCTTKLQSPVDAGSQDVAKAIDCTEPTQSSCFSFLDSAITGVSLYTWLTHFFVCTNGFYVLLSPGALRFQSLGKKS